MSFGFKLKIFPNPMRNDGVFISEDKEIEPYKSLGFNGERLHYPAVPASKFTIQNQLDPDFAAEIVRRWNLVEETKA